MRRRAAVGGRRGGHVKIQLVDMNVQPLQQLETVIAALARVRREHERLQLGQALARPEPITAELLARLDALPGDPRRVAAL
jgi:hypothetical protein